MWVADEIDASHQTDSLRQGPRRGGARESSTAEENYHITVTVILIPASHRSLGRGKKALVTGRAG